MNNIKDIEECIYEKIGDNFDIDMLSCVLLDLNIDVKFAFNICEYFFGKQSLQFFRYKGVKYSEISEQ